MGYGIPDIKQKTAKGWKSARACSFPKGALMSADQGLSESLENYLEVILELERTQKVARAKEIADRLQIQPGSVTGALKNLGEKGYIHYEPYSYITLTPKGRRWAEEITYRHQALSNFLLNVLQIDPATAEETACRMEHAIDKQTIDRLVRFIDFIFSCPRAGEQWIQSFADFCTAGRREKPDCVPCIQSIQTGK
jgi:DtxR family transcriptional regulator, Mn-dependent transcriptional regulator